MTHEDHLAGILSTQYEREPRRGYGAGTAEVLRQIAQGGEWRTLASTQVGGRGSHDNGAVMRATPFGLWVPDHRSAAELARRAALITHRHPHAVDAAGMQAAAIAAAMGRTDDHHGTVDRFLTAIRSVVTTDEMRARLEQAVSLSTATGAQVARRLGTGIARYRR